MTNLFSEEMQAKPLEEIGRKLKKITIQNYRNIDYKEYNLDSSNLLLEGENGLGKTNVIEAIFWALSGYLFNGTGKTESQEIIPYNAEKDIVTRVKLEFEYNLFSFERMVEQNWTSKGEYKGTVTKLFVNGAVSKDQSTAINALQNYLGMNDLASRFNSIPELSKLNLFDLLYNANSLRTIDYKIIRAIIIDMVGEADFKKIINENVEKYKILVEPLKAHGLDLAALKTSAKKSISDKDNGLEIQIKTLKSNIEEYEKDAEKVASKEEIANAETKIKEINKQIADLESQKTSSNDDKIEKINSKITEYRNKIYERQDILRQKHQEKLAEIEKNSNISEINKKNESLATKNREKQTLIGQINTQENARDRLQNSLDLKNSKLEHEQEILDGYKQEYKRIKKITNQFEETNDTCPICGTRFSLEEINTKGKEQTKVVNDLKIDIEDLEQNIEVANKEILKLQKEKEQLIKNIETLEMEISDLAEKNMDIETPILDFENDKDILNYNANIQTLTASKNALVNGNNKYDEELDNKIFALKEKRKPYEQIIASEATAESYRENAKIKRKTLKSLQEKLQVQEEIGTLIKELEKEMYEQLDKRIGVTFGENVQFKLWKLNVFNGEYDTRMCEIYVRDDFDRFVNIKTINTGMFPIRATELISKIKSYYHIPKSFIFIDEMSSLDNKHLEWLKVFEEQILATKVAELKSIKERKF
jgi:DNA repair exonuclease SbcCD ATPase subunit